MATMKTLGKALDLLQAFREEIDAFLPTQTAEVLLQVALKPGVSMVELQSLTGLASSSISRNVMMLSKWHRLHKPGYDLLEAIDDPRERRRKIIFLNAKGAKTVTKIMRILDPDFELSKVDAQAEVHRMARGPG